jgi:hypothetical protein
VNGYANLSLENVKLDEGSNPGRKLTTGIRRVGLEYDTRRRLIACRGRKDLELPYCYLGANDQAGPNYTRQPAVDSHYQIT